jgi:hypothetical protein
MFSAIPGASNIKALAAWMPHKMALLVEPKPSSEIAETRQDVAFSRDIVDGRTFEATRYFA